MKKKCRACNGTGKSGFSECGFCCGRGYYDVDITNEEWFATLPTRGKAFFINSVSFSCYQCGKNETEENCPFGKCRRNQADFLDWLKEVHKE